MYRLVILVGLPLGVCVTTSVRTISSAYTEPQDGSVSSHPEVIFPTARTPVVNYSHYFDKHDVEIASLASFTLPHKLSDIIMATMSTDRDANDDASSTVTVEPLIEPTVTRTKRTSTATLEAAAHVKAVEPGAPKIDGPIATQNVPHHPTANGESPNPYIPIATIFVVTGYVSWALFIHPHSIHIRRLNDSMWLPLPPGWLAALSTMILADVIIIGIALAPFMPNLEYLPFICCLIVAVRVKVLAGHMCAFEFCLYLQLLFATVASSQSHKKIYPFGYSMAVFIFPFHLLISQIHNRLRGIPYPAVGDEDLGDENFGFYIQSATEKLSFILILFEITLLVALGANYAKFTLRSDEMTGDDQPHIWLVVLLSLICTSVFSIVSDLPMRSYLAFTPEIILAYEFTHPSGSILNFFGRLIAFLIGADLPKLDLKQTVAYQTILCLLPVVWICFTSRVPTFHLRRDDQWSNPQIPVCQHYPPTQGDQVTSDPGC